ncbi:MAG: ABC transporter permease [Candidatus Caenarcaniphilales bacterium]|nr:ABC transporter permease [Candidatus Caenarcaniphilales bacterium]
MITKQLQDKLNEFKNNPKNSKYFNLLNRFLDSLLVLFGVALLTFLIVRIDVQVSEIRLFGILVFVFVSLIVAYFRLLQNNIYFLGILFLFAIIFWPIQSIFPSLKVSSGNPLEIFWKLFLFPLSWIFLLLAYTLRSYFTKSKILLSILGFCVLLGLGVWGVGKLPPPILKKEAKYVFKKPITIKAGDPLADLRLNPSIHPEALKREEARLGLDKPLYKQFLLWLDGILVRWDFGLTQQGEPVVDAIKKPLINTLILNIFVLVFTWILAVPAGMIAAINRGNWIDRLLLTFSSLSITTPAFLLTIFVLSFAVKFGMGKVGGLTSVDFDTLSLPAKILDFIGHLMLPVAIMTFVSLGGLIRQMRGNLLDVFNEDFIKSARARGIPENKILWGHAFQNAVNPLITLLGFEFAALVSGAALTEMILAYPGIGALTLEAAKKLDINLIMFNLLIGTIMLMLGNALADLLLRKVDPRTR